MQFAKKTLNVFQKLICGGWLAWSSAE